MSMNDMLIECQNRVAELEREIKSIKANVVTELVEVLIEASDNAGANGYLEEAQAMADASELISAHALQVMKIKDVWAA